MEIDALAKSIPSRKRTQLYAYVAKVSYAKFFLYKLSLMHGLYYFSRSFSKTLHYKYSVECKQKLTFKLA